MNPGRLPWAGMNDAFGVSTAATAEGAEQIRSISNPKGVRDLILAQRGSGQARGVKNPGEQDKILQ